ncbi:hypothetical protein ABPG75_003061 [Micractinium tetrahymenae]
MSTATGDLSARLQALLSRLFSLQDPEVLGYLAAGLEEDGEVDADELGDSLVGFSPSFAALPPAEQRRQVDNLLQHVAELRAEASAAAAAAAAAAAPTAAAGPAAAAGKPALAAVVSQTLSRLGSLSVGGGGSGLASSATASECDSDDEGGIRAWTPEQQAAVGTLRELCALPAETSDAFLADVLAGKGGGDLQAAAAWMLECEDLAAAEAAWRQAAERRREERARAAAEQEATKKQIVSRFSLQAVPTGGGSGGGKGKPPALQAWGADGKGKGGGDSGKVRFRDGVVATRAGQKYVIEAKVRGCGAGVKLRWDPV